MWAKVAIANENWQPLAQATIEAYSVDSPTTALTTAVTDNGGIALFLNLPSGRIFFKPRVTRSSGQYGDTTQNGVINLQIIASSAGCVDALVDGSGQFGTDSTIQAAVTRLAAKGTKATVFVMDGVYNENVVFASATTDFYVEACGPNLTKFALTYATNPLSVAINGGSGISVQHTGAASLTLKGFEISNNAAGTVGSLVPDAGDTTIIDCYVNNSSSGPSIYSAASPVSLRVERCVVGITAANIAIQLPASPSQVWLQNSWLIGLVNTPNTAGGCDVLNCFISTNRTDFALRPGGIRGRVQGCRIVQSGTGNGIDLANSGTQQFPWAISGCSIEGPGATGQAVNVGNNNVVLLTNNTFYNWNTGINFTASSDVTGKGNKYISVTFKINGTTPTGGMTLDGIWLAVPYVAGNFTANAGATWTVDAADADFNAMLDGFTLHLDGTLSTTTIAGGPPNVLTITIPFGKTASRSGNGFARIIDGGGGISIGIATVNAGSTFFTLSKLDVTNIAAGVNNIQVRFTIEFEIQ